MARVGIETTDVLSATMRFHGRTLLSTAAAASTAAGSLLNLPMARADLHNITYRARIDAVTTGSQATFIINGGHTNTTGLSSVPGNAFEADTVLPDPHEAGMRIVLHFPYSANVHCEIDVDDNVFVQLDQVVRPLPGNADPTNGVLGCGAPVPG